MKKKTKHPSTFIQQRGPYPQIFALSGQGALQSPVNPVDGRFLWVGVHAVQARAASLFHQSGNARTAEGLFELLDELEKSPGRKASA